jgi:hypothetical protein
MTCIYISTSHSLTHSLTHFFFFLQSLHTNQQSKGKKKIAKKKKKRSSKVKEESLQVSESLAWTMMKFFFFSKLEKNVKRRRLKKE